MATEAPVVKFNTQLMAEDMAAKGLDKLGLAEASGVSDMTVIRFLRGERQTNPTLKKLAKGLGQKPERYILRASEAA